MIKSSAGAQGQYQEQQNQLSRPSDRDICEEILGAQADLVVATVSG